MKKTTVICLLLSLATGCMSPAEREQQSIESKQKLTENPGSICRFTVNRNYREVYRIAKTGMLDAGMRTEEVKGELYTDIEKSEITVQVSGWFGVSTILHVEIKALSQETSEYTEYYFYKWRYKHNQEEYCAGIKRFIEE